MVIQLPIQDLTPEAFAPFGDVIEQPDRPADGGGPGWQWWGGVSILPVEARPYGIGYLDLKPVAETRFDWAERHEFTPELLVPTGGECLIHVAPPDFPDKLDQLPPLERFQIFRLRPGQAVLLKPKVWHGAPLALHEPTHVVVLLYKDTGSSNTSVVRFDGVIEAVTGS